MSDKYASEMASNERAFLDPDYPRHSHSVRGSVDFVDWKSLRKNVRRLCRIETMIEAEAVKLRMGMI